MSALQNVCNKVLSNSLFNYRHAACKRISTTAYFSTRKLSVEEKLGLKPKPKRPPPPYLRFSVKMQPKILQENPKAHITEISKRVAEEWKKIDPKLKDKLLQEYKNEWLKYVEECKEHDRTLTPADREEILKAKEEQKIANEKKAYKKKLGELGCPKRPASSYLLFMMDRASQRGNLPFKEWQTQISKDWKLISESEKEKYNEQYKKEKEVYKVKLHEWEKEMQKTRHKDVELKENTLTDDGIPHEKLIIDNANRKIECEEVSPIAAHKGSYKATINNRLYYLISVQPRIITICIGFAIFSSTVVGVLYFSNT